MERSELLSAEDLAVLLGVTRKQVYAMRERGQAPPARRIRGVGLRWLMADVNTWLAAQPEG